MAGKKLKVSVTVRDPESGEATTYQAGDEVPADQAKLITNPDVWDEGDDQDDDQDEVPGDAQFSVPDPKEVEENAKPRAEPDKPKSSSPLGRSSSQSK